MRHWLKMLHWLHSKIKLWHNATFSLSRFIGPSPASGTSIAQQPQLKPGLLLLLWLHRLHLIHRMHLMPVEI